MESDGNEMKEWQTKYDPRKLSLGMVDPDCFVNANDNEYFDQIKNLIENYERHTGERLYEDLRKYLLYCGAMFYDWSAHCIMLVRWNETDQKDQTRYCLWCEKTLYCENCGCEKFSTIPDNVKETNLDLSKMPGVIIVSHEGCGKYSYLVIHGNRKGTIWKEYDGIYKKRYDSFKEYLDCLYRKK